MNRRTIITIVVVIVIILLAGYGLFQVSKSRTFQVFGSITNRVETDKKVVALTFDDAPTGITSDEVLRIIGAKNVKATFYVIGQNIEKYPAETKRIVAAGHELGNHSYSHQRFLLKDLGFVEDEVDRTNALIRQAGYTKEITFRPPYGKKLFALPWYLQEHNIRTITWDVEPDTYVAGNADALLTYTLDHTKPGSIILLHPFCDKECEAARKALPQIIDALKQLGYEFVTVSELLKYK